MDTLLRIVAIAQQGFYEAWRSRLFMVLTVVVGLSIGLAQFASALVLTGTLSTKLAIYSFSIRLALMAMFAIYTSQALIRDRIDKQTELFVSLDMKREIYFLGRLLGFYQVIVLAVIITILYPGYYTDLSATAGWGISLITELAIIVTLSAFITLSLNNVTASFITVSAFYLLARSMGNLLLLAQSPILQGQEAGIEWARSTLRLLNLLLPDLWHFVRTEWLLIEDFSWAEPGNNLLVACVYCLLLFMAACFDLHRKNL